MPLTSESRKTTETSVPAEQDLALELAMVVLRRRARDLSDRLYRELRPYGVSL
jgi:hypothetical protein